MTDVQELRRHIRLLEDQVQYGDNVAGELAALSEQVDRLEGRIESLDQSNAELRTLLAELINAFNRNIDRMAGGLWTPTQQRYVLASTATLLPSQPLQRHRHSRMRCSSRMPRPSGRKRSLGSCRRTNQSQEMPDGGARVGSPLVRSFVCPAGPRAIGRANARAAV